MKHIETVEEYIREKEYKKGYEINDIRIQVTFSIRW